MKILPKTFKNPQGFTLIELLVVIAIIAVLAVIAFASFAGLTGRGNDARRRVDIKAIADVYEVRRSPTAADYATLTLVGTDFAGGAIPADPISARSYCILTSTSAAVANATVVTGIANGILATGVCSGTWATQVLSAALPASTTFWKVCSLLSNNTSVVCVGSKQ